MASFTADVEEGEITDSDGEKINEPPQQIYRTKIPQIVINSEESSDSEDDYPKLKRTHAGNEDYTVPFVNPLLAANPQPSVKKRNNIWGSVLTEQVLAQEVKSFSVGSTVLDERDVESYDYTKAREDERPALKVHVVDDSIFADDTKREDTRQRKRKHCKDNEYFGKKRLNKHRLRSLTVTANSSLLEVVEAITKGLSEPKVELFTQIVQAVGHETAIKLYQMTDQVEAAGGMMTCDGYRRRSPGGVYIQLLKSDSSVPSETIQKLFEADQLQWKKNIQERRKIKKAARRKFKKHKKKMEVDAIDQVLAPPEDSNDNSDLLDRPTTPEPKDDSSDGPWGPAEEEEDEDIAEAIAKAKAALIKRQRELTMCASQGDNPSNDAGDMEEMT
ncbi:phosphorylated adapter RNA export protein-like [Physella acuta]|uniref:phosphorylated adapter RNA export protein-like n=1 Tax=Physella acuta TaxID=109671 RepID=UPI0027DCF026|nr:phosphorylated adapter RNA export protein-like [Physella acuta]